MPSALAFLCVILGGLAYLGLGLRIIARHYGPPRPRRSATHLLFHLFGNTAFLLVALLYLNRQTDPGTPLGWIATGLVLLCGGIVSLILLALFLRYVGARDSDRE